MSALFDAEYGRLEFAVRPINRWQVGRVHSTSSREPSARRWTSRSSPRCRRRGRRHSDLDIGAWFPVDPPHGWDVDVPAGVDLVVLNSAPLELAGRIGLEGTILFDDDPPARVHWVADTRKIWLDERPRFERAHREFLEAAARGR